MKKKSISLFLVFVMLFSLFGSGSMQVNAADEAKYIYDAAVLSDGTVAVLYISDGTVYYGIYDPQTSRWSKEEVAAGKDCALSVDAADVPYIAYITTDDNLGYIYDTGGHWSTPEIIDSVAFGGIDGALTSPDIVVDNNGYAHLTYFDAAGGYTGGNDYASYDKPDLMYATNTSGSFVKSIRSYSQGWFWSPNGWRNWAIAPAKITYANDNYWIGLMQYQYDKDMYGQYHTYYYNVLTTPATPSNDLSWLIHSSSTNNSYGFKLFDVDTDGTNVYSLFNQSSTLYITNGVTEIATATKATTVNGADLCVANSGSLYYAGIYTSSLLLYQNGTFKESLVLPSSIGSHTRIATVCDSDSQYVLYTDTTGALQIAAVSLLPGDTNVTSYEVPDLIPVTISGVSVSDKTYDGSAAAYTGTPGAVETASGDPVSISQYTYTWYDVTDAATLASAPSDAGSYKLIISVAESDGTYTGSTEIPFTINKKSLTISGVTAGNRVYNGSTSVTIANGTLNGVVGTDQVIPAVPVSGTVATANVGKDKPVTIADITLSGTDAANYTLTQPTGITVDISPATLTISGVTATDRDYNGTTTVDITGGALSGVIGDDEVTPVVPSTGSIPTATAGKDKAVTIATITLSGDDAGNYALTQPTGITVNIDPVTLTISGIAATDRDYNGTTAVDITGGALNGVIGDDEVSPVIPSTGSVPTASAGKDKAVTIATITLSGDDAGNYALTQPTGVTVNIDPVTLTINGVTAGNRNYNGSTSVTIANGTLNGVIGLDQVIPVVPVSGTVATAAAGDDKPVTIAAITLSGTDAANYTLTQPTGITVDISPANLTISGVTATDRDYNGTTAVDITGGALNGVVGDDKVTPLVPSTGSIQTAAAGKDKAVTIATITLSGDDAGNYTLTQPTGITVNIDPVTLTISGIAATNRDYNGTTAVDITGGDLNGVVEKDDVSPAVPAIGRMATAAAGNNKAVTIATITLSGDDAGNYTLTQPTGITVDIDTATLTISGVTAGNRNYNGSTSVTIANGTLNGVIGLDQVMPVVPVSGTVTTANAGDDKPVTVATITLTGTDAANYSLTQPTGITVNISPAPLAIASQTVADKTYDGTTAATVSAVTFSGLQNGETLTGGVDYSAIANFINSTAGTGKSVSGTVRLLATVKANNYSLAVGAFSDTATISKAGGLNATEPDDIQMTKNLSKSYQYDLDSIALNKTDTGTVTYSLNLLTGDDIFDSDPAVDGSQLHFTSAEAAAGTATQTVNIHSQNYQDITVDLTFILVDRKTVTISGVSVADKSYDGTAVSYTGTPAATETEGGATANIDQYTYTWYEGATSLPAAPKDAGSYSLKIAVAADDENYMGETTVDFTISKKELTVKPMNKTIFTDAPFPMLEIAYAGLVTGEAAADVISFDEDLTMEIQNGAGAPLADTGVNGTYPIVFTNQPAYDSDNYTVVWADGTLTIKSEVTVIIETEGDTTTVLPAADVNEGFAGAVMNDADTEAILSELNTKGATALVITLDAAEDIEGMEVSMSKAIADEMADRSGTLVISTPVGEIFLEETALAAVKDTAGDTLTFSIRENNDGTVTIEIKVDDTVLTDLGYIKVTLPRGLTPGQVLVTVAEDSSETIIKKAYPTDDGVIAFLPGSATVKVVDHTTAFNDVSNDYWAKDAIAFVRSRELFFGTSNDKFSPSMTMTRAMFTTVLYRLEGCPDIGTGSSFSDVPEGTWYTVGVNWAAQNGIVMGIGNGKFEPQRSITREEMAVIVYRYCNAMGYDTSARGSLDDFVDGATVSTWARTAMSYAVGSGLIKGKNKNNLDPKAYATRAEVAMILQRMIGVILK